MHYRILTEPPLWKTKIVLNRFATATDNRKNGHLDPEKYEIRLEVNIHSMSVRTTF